mgnify:CR=1 FL=1
MLKRKTPRKRKDYLLFLIDQKHFLSICLILIDLNFLKEKNIKLPIGTANGEDTAFLIKILATANVNFVGENLFPYHLGRKILQQTTIQLYQPFQF